MGQMTLALFVGVEYADADSEAAWEKMEDLSEAWRRSGKNRGWGQAECVEFPSEAGRFLVGFYAAVGASGHVGCPDFLETATPLDELATTEPFKSNIVRAEKTWAKFAAFALKRGFEFGPAKLWITPTEVA